MPPFVNTTCVYCKIPNRLDLAELRKKGNGIASGVLFRGKADEFEVTCQHCGRNFKFKAKGRNYGEKR